MFTACDGRTKQPDIVRRPDILDTVQAEIDQKVRLTEQKKTVQLELDGLRLVPPDDYLEMIGIFDGTGDRIIQFNSDYDRMVYESFDNAFVFNFSKYQDFSVSFHYYRRLDRLETDSSTNELLTKYSNVYFRGMVREIFLDDEDYDAAAAYGELFDDAINMAQADTIKRELDLEHVEDYNSQQFQV